MRVIGRIVAMCRRKPYRKRLYSNRSVFLEVERLEERTVPADLYWTGAVSNLWSDRLNWQDCTGGPPPKAPDASTTVAIQPNDGLAVCEVNGAASAKSVSMDNGTLQIDAGATLDAGDSVSIDGGRAVVLGTLMSMTVSNNSPGQGILLLGGTIGNGCTTVQNNGRITVTGQAGQPKLDGWLTNSGQIRFSSQFPTLTVTGDFTQTHNGTLTVVVDPRGACSLVSVGGFVDLAGSLEVQKGGTADPTRTIAYEVITYSQGALRSSFDSACSY